MPRRFLHRCSLSFGPSQFRPGSWSLALSALAACPPPNDGGSTLPQLILTEVAAHALGPAENVRGGVILEDQIFFWTPQGAWFVGDTVPRRNARCSTPLSGILGAGVSGAGLVVLDTTAQAIFELNPTTSCHRLRSAPFRNLIAASPTDSGWLLVQRTSAERASLLLLAGGSDSPRITQLDLAAGSNAVTQADWWFLAKSGRHSFLGAHRAASGWVVLGPDGKVRVRAGPAATRLGTASLSTGVSDDTEWHQLPPLDLGRAYLQVLVDLRSDRRRLLLYDRNGRVVRSRELVAPIGFFAADPAQHLLLGMRMTSGAELVVYRWAWEAGSDAVRSRE